MNPHILQQPSHTWNGTTYRTILSTAETDGVLSIVQGAVGPRDGPPTLIHDNEDDMFLILEGVIDFDLDRQQFRRGPMETAFPPRGMPVSFRAGPDGATAVTVITPGGFDGFFAKLGAGGFALKRDFASVAACGTRFGSRITGSVLLKETDMRDIAFIVLPAAVVCVTCGMI